MSLFLLSLLILLAFSTPPSEGLRILVYSPKFAHSHSAFAGTIADLLVDAGHNVTTLIPIIDSSLHDGTRKSQIIYVPPAPAAAAAVAKLMSADLDFFEIRSDSVDGIRQSSAHNAAFFSSQCAATLTHPGLLDRLRDAHFDVFITEVFSYCGMGIHELIGSRALITILSFSMLGGHAEDLNAPQLPSYDPAVLTSYWGVDTVFLRLRNVFWHSLFNGMFATHAEAEQRVYDNLYGQKAPNLREAAGRAAYTFINSDPLIDFALPTLSRIVPIAGITSGRPGKPLSKEWDEVLRRRPQAVLVSFGSIAKTTQMSIQRKRSMLKAFSSFSNVTFIWKYEDLADGFARSEVAAVPNVVLSNWFPQADLLHDDRVAAFITHGGIGSTFETARHGVPALVVPIFGDQSRNGAVLVHAGIGLLYDKFELVDTDKFSAAIRDVLQPSLAEKARHMSAMLAARPFAPSELLLRHVEFAGRFGAVSSMRPLAAGLSLFQKHHVDLILIVLATLLLGAATVAFVLIRIAQRVIRVVNDKSKAKAD